jgi:hypothetical protein
MTAEYVREIATPEYQAAQERRWWRLYCKLGL